MTLKLKTVRGAQYWVARFQRNGKAIEKSLGRKDALSKTAAKRKHDALALSLDAGVIPGAPAKKPACPTFAEAWPEMLSTIAELRKWKNPRSREAWARSLGGYAEDAFGGKRVDVITRDDVLALLKPLWETKTETASRLRMRLEAFFSWAKMMGLTAGDNPAAWAGGLEFLLPSASRVKPVRHHEALTMDELRKVAAYCSAHPSPVSAILLFIIATAARVSEARLAEASEIEGDTWVMPANRRKDGQDFPHRVPLSTLAKEALAMAEKEGLLFTSDGRRPLALDSPRLKLRAIVGRAVTAHGIRSSFRDWAAVSGVDFVAAEKALSHKVGSQVTQAYLREDMLAARRPIMQQWADALKMPQP